MIHSNTVTPQRYESPEINIFRLSAEDILCQSGTTDAPDGFDWDEWGNN